ncbi:hypothetical protein SBRY_20637 [Actinacidiphila bryophytorum]|uniref:Uncharacterized protein n=1 Tax=Actinacidiphila bryophytorum TaxID=1436133 RepID=A0A9W4E504_9ACTN|nr:hypothetical protein SBRY_20637 [Actinacidiphila bryophytorum]
MNARVAGGVFLRLRGGRTRPPKPPPTCGDEADLVQRLDACASRADTPCRAWRLRALSNGFSLHFPNGSERMQADPERTGFRRRLRPGSRRDRFDYPTSGEGHHAHEEERTRRPARPAGRTRRAAAASRRRPGPVGHRRLGRRGRAGAAGRLDHGLQRRLQRRVGVRPEPGRLALRHRYGLRLPGRRDHVGHRRDRDGHRLDRQRLPGRIRAPGDQADQGRVRALDLGPDRDPAHRLRGARGRPVGDQRVAQAARTGQRPRLLARLLGDGRRRPPGRCDQLAEHRRAGHHGGRQRAEPALDDLPLRCVGGRVPRPRRHQQRAAGVQWLPDRLPHLLGGHRPHQHRGRAAAVPARRAGDVHGQREPGLDRHLAGRCRPRLLRHLRRGDRRFVPEQGVRVHLAVCRHQLGRGDDGRLDRRQPHEQREFVVRCIDGYVVWYVHRRHVRYVHRHDVRHHQRRLQRRQYERPRLHRGRGDHRFGAGADHLRADDARRVRGRALPRQRRGPAELPDGQQRRHLDADRQRARERHRVDVLVHVREERPAVRHPALHVHLQRLAHGRLAPPPRPDAPGRRGAASCGGVEDHPEAGAARQHVRTGPQRQGSARTQNS